jgi:hypothetical protein
MGWGWLFGPTDDPTQDAYWSSDQDTTGEEMQRVEIWNEPWQQETDR